LFSPQNKKKEESYTGRRDKGLGKRREMREGRSFGMLSCQNVRYRWEDTDEAFLLINQEIKHAGSCSNFLVPLYCNIL